ncbi:shikimate dehydrogenase, partial [Bifidobacterium italicum]
AVLGKPIAHSLSPVLHEAAYRALGLDGWSYGRIEMDEDGLAGFLDSLDAGWAGLSLTMPLKRTIQPYGTPSNLWARELGVANTAVFADGATRLYNTDVYGIARAFAHAAQAQGVQPEANQSAVILGNGNTATSALAAYVMMGGVTHVTVAARHPQRTPGLAEIGARHGVDVTTAALDDAHVPALLADADLVVNTIPAHGADAVANRLDEAGVSVRGMLLDVVYDPRPTELMEIWERLGGVALGGEEMLLYQAVAQVLLMTGLAADDDFDAVDGRSMHGPLEQAMREALEEAL